MIEGQEKPSLEDLVHHGIKGMHWGVRKEYTRNDLTEDISGKEYRRRRLQIEAREYKTAEARRKAVQKKTGVKYWKSVKGAPLKGNGLAIKTKYSDDEIQKARANQLARKAERKSIENDGSREAIKRYNKLSSELQFSHDRVIANFKTRGERTVATILLGPVGSYRSGNTRGQVIRRTTERDTKYGFGD